MKKRRALPAGTFGAAAAAFAAAVITIASCGFLFTFDNPADFESENFNGVVRMDNVERIERGANSDLLILADGRVFFYKSQGIETVPRLPDGIVDLSSSGSHVLALEADGTVWSWGYNESGRLGRVVDEGDMDPDNRYVERPGKVTEMDIPPTFVRASGSFSAAGTGTETMYIWGVISSGNILLRYDTPYAVSWGVVSDIAVGEDIIILRSDGTVHR